MKKDMATDTKLTTKAQKAKKLMEEAQGLFEEAKNEQLDIINAAIAELKDLGYSYSLTEAHQTPKSAPKQPKAAKATAKAAPGPSANYDESKTCQYCNGMKSHDGRAHRNQDPKKAFTQQELSDRGLLPPA